MSDLDAALSWVGHVLAGNPGQRLDLRASTANGTLTPILQLGGAPIGKMEIANGFLLIEATGRSIFCRCKALILGNNPRKNSLPEWSSVVSLIVIGASVIWLLTALFAGLKLVGFIDWSWWVVVVPLWLPLAIAVAVGAFVLLFYGYRRASEIGKKTVQLAARPVRRDKSQRDAP